MARILSVNLAVPERSTATPAGVTGIDKQPVAGRVAVRAPGTTRRPSGLAGDQIFDTANHGGDDQAVYAYAREDYDWWEQRLGRALPDGLFGENLTTTGLDVNAAVVGEHWRVGDRLVLEPTFGRIPCATFQERMGEPHWVRTFAREDRPGAYLRVVTPGDVHAGDPVTVVHRPAHGVTIAVALRAYLTETARLPDLVATPGLPDALRARLSRRLPT